MKPSSPLRPITNGWVAVVQLMASVILAFATWGLLTATRRYAKAAETGNKIAEASNEVAHTRNELIREQHKAAEFVFNTQHRPRLRVRKVSIPIIDDWDLPLQNLGYFEITNIGGTEAMPLYVHVNIRTSVVFGRIGEDFKDCDPGNELFPGDSFTAKIEDSVEWEPDLVDELRQGTKPLFVIGAVGYMDRLNYTYWTGFCRKYNPTTMRFDIVKDPDYEYED